jgi:hypothetical protein
MFFKTSPEYNNTKKDYVLWLFKQQGITSQKELDDMTARCQIAGKDLKGGKTNAK